jgi:hypothetical protein
MPKKGTYTALQKLQPDTTDYAKMIADNEKLQFAYRKEAADKKALKDADKEKRAKELATDLNGLKPVLTEIEDLDTSIMQTVSGAADMRLELFKEAQKNPTIVGTADYQMKLSNVNNTSRDIATLTAAHLEYSTAITEMDKNDEISEWDEDKRQEVSAIYKGRRMHLRNNKNTGKLEAYTMIPDLDNPGEEKVVEIKVQDYLDKSALSKINKKIKWDEEMLKTGSALGKRELQRKDGAPYETITESKFETIKPQVENDAEIRFGTEEEQSYEAHFYWADKMHRAKPKSGKLTEAQIKEVKADYVNEISKYYDETISSKIDRPPASNTSNNKTGGGGSLVLDKNDNVTVYNFSQGSGKPRQGFGVGLPSTVGIRKDKNTITTAKNIYIEDDGSIRADINKSKIPVATQNQNLSLQELIIQMNSSGNKWETNTERVLLSDEDATNLILNKVVKKADGSSFADLADFRSYYREIAKSKGYSPNSTGNTTTTTKFN